MLNKLRFLLFLVLITHVAVLAQFAGGSGTEEDPWLIRTAENLDSIRYFCGEYVSGDNYFKQIADINLGISPWSDGEGWEPIGNDFVIWDRSYDGNGYIIRNLFINKPTSDLIGLFGRTNGIELKNINISNANVTGYRYVGALVGKTDYTRIYNSSCSGIVNGYTYVGGFVGDVYTYTHIMNCYNKVEVTGIGRIGGLVGNGGGSIVTENSYSFSPSNIIVTHENI